MYNDRQSKIIEDEYHVSHTDKHKLVANSGHLAGTITTVYLGYWPTHQLHNHHEWQIKF